MKPEDAKFPGFEFIIRGQRCFVGLFSINNPDFPDIIYPALLQLIDTSWVEIDKHDVIWDDLQQDLAPEIVAKFAIEKFNITLETVGGGIAMTWTQKLAAIFQLQLAVENNQLVIK